MIAAATGLPAVPTGGCPVLLHPLCATAAGAAGAAGSVASGVFGAGAGAVLDAVAGWVTSGAAWLLGQVGAALTATTSVNVGAGWFRAHYAVMVGLAAVVVLPMLLAAVVQAVYRQSADILVRAVVVQLPLAALLGAAAVQLVQLALAATDALGSTVASGAGGNIAQALSGLAKAVVAQGAVDPQGPPAFVVLLGGLLVAFGAFVLWVELLVRAAAVYVAVLFLPLALASMVWPALSHWCRRLVETLAALILSKFVIQTVLALAASALASGTGSGFASVLGGGALLLLATFVPFTLLRLIPAVEAGAVQHLEGVRHRARAALGSVPRTAASYALRAAGASSLVAGEAGTGLATALEAPGGDAPGGGAGPGGGDRSGGAAGPGGGAGPGDSAGPGGGAVRPDTAGVPMWRGHEPPGAGGADPRRDPGRVPMSEGGDPSGRGPLPLWGGPVPGTGSPGDADRADRRRARESFVVDQDAMGPVLRWVPPEQDR